MCPNISSLRQFIADLNVRIVPPNCASVGSPGREQHEITGPGDNAADVSIGLTWNSQITANTSQVSELQSAFPPLHHKLHEADRMGKSLLFPCFSAWPEPPLHDTARAATQKYKIINHDLLPRPKVSLPYLSPSPAAARLVSLQLVTSRLYHYSNSRPFSSLSPYLYCQSLPSGRGTENQICT